MKIDIYTRRNCKLCNDVKHLLDNKNAGYTEYIIDENITREGVINMFPDRKVLPIVVVDGICVEDNRTLPFLIDEKREKEKHDV